MHSSAQVSAIIAAILSLMSPNSPMGRPNARRSPHRSTAILMTRLHMPERPARQPEAPAVEHLHRDLEAAPRLAQHVARGDAHVLEEHLRRRAAADAELVLGRAALHAPAALDQERRDLRLRPLVGGRGAREDREEVREAAVGDPDLGPVEDVAVARAARPASGWRRRRSRRRARSARRRRPSRRSRGAGGTGPSARATRRGAGPSGRSTGGPPTRHGDARVERPELLQDAGVAGLRQPRPAVALRHQHPEEPELLEPAQHLAGNALLAVDVRRVDPRWK